MRVKTTAQDIIALIQTAGASQNAATALERFVDDLIAAAVDAYAARQCMPIQHNSDGRTAGSIKLGEE